MQDCEDRTLRSALSTLVPFLVVGPFLHTLRVRIQRQGCQSTRMEPSPVKLKFRDTTVVDGVVDGLV